MANIKLKNNLGVEQTFNGVTKIKIPKADGSGNAEFTEPTPTQTKSVALSMGSGDQTITPDSGYALTSVTVQKPATMLAENIKKDVVIGGVTGTFEGGGGNRGCPIIVINYVSYTMEYEVMTPLSIGGYNSSQLKALCQANGSYKYPYNSVSFGYDNWCGCLYEEDIRTITGVDITSTTTSISIGYSSDYGDYMCYVDGSRLRGSTRNYQVGLFGGASSTILITIGYDD